LYDRLQHKQDDAYLYYNALLNRLNSFCSALELSCKYKHKQSTDPTALERIQAIVGMQSLSMSGEQERWQESFND
jgi:hypothetical protein